VLELFCAEIIGDEEIDEDPLISLFYECNRPPFRPSGAWSDDVHDKLPADIGRRGPIKLSAGW